MADDGRFSNKPQTGEHALANKIALTLFIPTKSIPGTPGPSIRRPAQSVLA
ncbi:MAG TPA: hypothetical protein PKY50_01730 [Candidatus Competibacter sp.]|nr:hypothetical protein [Candidatus Competibacter sp.]